MSSYQKRKIRSRIKERKLQINNNYKIKYEFYTLNFYDSEFIYKVLIRNNIVHLFRSTFDLSAIDMNERRKVIITEENQDEWSDDYKEEVRENKPIPLDEYIGSLYTTKIFYGKNTEEEAHQLINKLGKRYSFVNDQRDHEASVTTLLLQINPKKNIYAYLSAGFINTKQNRYQGFYFFKSQSPILYFSALSTTNRSTADIHYPIAIDSNGNIYELENRYIFLYKDSSDIISYWRNLDEYNRNIKRKNLSSFSSIKYLKIKDESFLGKIFDIGTIKIETLEDVLKHHKDIIENNKKVIVAFDNGYIGEISLSRYQEIYNELVEKLGKQIPINVIEYTPEEDNIKELKKLLLILENTDKKWPKVRAIQIRKILNFLLERPVLKKKYKNLITSIK